jgi:DUF1009 family protein
MTTGKFDALEQCRAEVEEKLLELHNKLDTHVLTDLEIEKIADKAANKAIEKLTTMAYLEIGKGVVAKVFKIVGIIAAFGVFYWHDKIWPTK